MFGNNSKKLLAAIKSLQITANAILANQEKMMSSEQNLQDALDQLTASVATSTTIQAKILTDLQAEIALLSAQTGPVTQSQLDALTNQAQAALASVNALNASMTGEDATLQPPAPTPAA